MIQESPTQDIRLGELTSRWAKSNNLYVEYKSSMSSTSDLAKSKAFEEELLDEAVCLFLTDTQSAGRGRGTHTWTSPQAGSALLSSWSYLLNVNPQPSFAALVGLAVYRALSSTWPFLNWSLKAPNDIYLNSKKVAGILLENVVQGDETRAIIGLGLNVFNSPANLDISTSIAEELPSGVPLLGQDYMAFLDRLFFEITDAISNCDQGLTPTDQFSLVSILNKNPLLKKKVTMISADGSLQYEDGSSQHWSQI